MLSNAMNYTTAFLGLLGVLILFHEVGHYVIARLCGVRVLRFSLGFGRPLFSWQRAPGETEWVISLLPLGGYVRMLDEHEGDVPEAQLSQAFNRQKLWRRNAIVLAGPLANFLLAFLLYTLLYWFWPANMQVISPEAYAPDNLPRLGKVVPGGAADRAGLRAGDDILSINNLAVDRWDEFAAQIRRFPGQPVDLLVTRQEVPGHIQVVPDAVEVNGQRVGRIGVMMAPKPEFELLEIPSYNFVSAAGMAGVEVWQKSWVTVSSLFGMLTGETSLKQLAGPVSIVDYAGQTARSGLADYLKFMAILSVSLGVLNLLPIPVLDGGHLMYHGLEWLRGKPLPREWVLRGQRVGMAMVLFLMFVALFNDVSRFISG